MKHVITAPSYDGLMYIFRIWKATHNVEILSTSLTSNRQLQITYKLIK